MQKDEEDLISVGDEGLHWLTAVLNFSIFNRPKKNLNSNYTQFIQGFQSRQKKFNNLLVLLQS